MLVYAVSALTVLGHLKKLHGDFRLCYKHFVNQ